MIEFLVIFILWNFLYVKEKSIKLTLVDHLFFVPSSIHIGIIPSYWENISFLFIRNKNQEIIRNIFLHHQNLHISIYYFSIFFLLNKTRILFALLLISFSNGWICFFLTEIICPLCRGLAGRSISVRRFCGFRLPFPR